MKVAIIGSGYVGCVTGVSLAAHGHRVTLVDSSIEVVAALRRGHAPFHEPGLTEALTDLTSRGALTVTDDLAAAVSDSELVFICVGTPSSADGSIDLTQVRGAVAAVLAGPDDGQTRVLVLKSTVVPGTTLDHIGPLADSAPGRWSVAVNPEFLREGQAVNDGMAPDRIVYGSESEEAARALEALYEPFGAPIIGVSPPTAELIKYTSNALLATLISFSNEIANIAEALPGVAVEDVFHAIHLDRRLRGAGGHPAPIVSYLVAGCGFGGSCLPKDIAALGRLAASCGIEPNLLTAVEELNASRADRMIQEAESRLGGLTSRRIAVLGLAFKPDTDDVRASPAIPIVNGLVRHGALVHIFDPAAREQALRLWPDEPAVSVAESVNDALRDADAVLLVTSWPEFRHISAERFNALMRTPIVIDGRGMTPPAERQGLQYWAIGYGPGAQASDQGGH